MLETISKNLLAYAAGQHIFCRGCQGVLDKRRTVSCTVTRPDKSPIELVRCGDCYDRIAAALPICYTLIDVLDGRVVFARRKRSC